MDTVLITVQDIVHEHYEDCLFDVTDCSFFCDLQSYDGFYFYRKYIKLTVWFLPGLICVENIGVGEGLAP